MAVCAFCNIEYNSKTKRSSYCSNKCKNTHWYSLNKEHKKEYYSVNISSIKDREKSYSISGKRKENNKL